jgi:hypothetical protein
VQPVLEGVVEALGGVSTCCCMMTFGIYALFAFFGR